MCFIGEEKVWAIRMTEAKGKKKLSGAIQNPEEIFTKLERVGKGSYGSVFRGFYFLSFIFIFILSCFLFDWNFIIKIQFLWYQYRIDKRTSKTVAIKVVDIDNEEDDIQEIQSEITLLSRCDCNNITRYYGSYVHIQTSKLWIIMDFCGGGSIRQLVIFLSNFNFNFNFFNNK